MNNTKNHCGLLGLSWIEFANPPGNKDVVSAMFTKAGMKCVATHRDRPLKLFRQGRVQFVLNEDPESAAVAFAKQHGPSATATGFRVRDPKAAWTEAVRRGAQPFTSDVQGHASKSSSGWTGLPAVYGIGDSLIYFENEFDEGRWNWLSDERNPVGFGMSVIDHLTNNVPRGEMQKWCQFYENIFGFEERRFFDIKGKSTGLISKVMKSPCGTFSIPINEPTDAKSQIQEYLDEYKGSGIQHIALLTEDIMQGVRDMLGQGIDFLAAPPSTYYQAVPNRLPIVREPISDLQRLGILVDGDDKGYLLQIFTKNQVGPIFLEVIQRRGHDGFGDGNFQALFDAMEEDQRLRGVL